MGDDLLEWVSSLPRIENYTEKDRYSDFRKLFMGSTIGKRVLRYILERGCVFQEPRLVSPIDSHMLSAQRGKRQLALEILAFTNNEPPERPQKARSDKRGRTS